MPVSFTIALGGSPEFVFVPEESEEYGSNAGAGCPGVVGGVPQAESGKFCVYATAGAGFEGAAVTSFDASTLPPAAADPGPAGAILLVKCEELFCVASGLWAVTG